MTPDPRFSLHRESLALPGDVWEWLETCAEASNRTRSDIASEHLRAAMTQPEETPK